MSKDYQKKTARTRTSDQPPTSVAVPDVVSVAMSEIAADVREGLLAIAVGAGLQVMTAMMAADVDALCGPRGRHDADRTATRHGSEAGAVTLGGRRLPVRRPRVRAVDGTEASRELPIASYETFTGTEVLGRKAMEQMLAGLSSRRYHVGLEPVGEHVTSEATSTSKSAVSRRFVKATEHALADLLSQDLSSLDLVAFMVDGVHFADHVCVVALGITIDGTKVPLAIEEGSTENATLVTSLIVGLRERGLDVTKPVLAVLDGSKALRRAVLDVFDHPVIARCQIHKIRKVPAPRTGMRFLVDENLSPRVARAPDLPERACPPHPHRPPPAPTLRRRLRPRRGVRRRRSDGPGAARIRLRLHPPVCAHGHVASAAPVRPGLDDACPTTSRNHCLAAVSTRTCHGRRPPSAGTACATAGRGCLGHKNWPATGEPKITKLWRASNKIPAERSGSDGTLSSWCARCRGTRRDWSPRASDPWAARTVGSRSRTPT